MCKGSVEGRNLPRFVRREESIRLYLEKSCSERREFTQIWVHTRVKDQVLNEDR
jgi:hypothetical protein